MFPGLQSARSSGDRLIVSSAAEGPARARARADKASASKCPTWRTRRGVPDRPWTRCRCALLNLPSRDPPGSGRRLPGLGWNCRGRGPGGRRFIDLRWHPLARSASPRFSPRGLHSLGAEPRAPRRSPNEPRSGRVRRAIALATVREPPRPRAGNDWDLACRAPPTRRSSVRTPGPRVARRRSRSAA